MHWRAEDLHRSRCNELRQALTVYFLHCVGEQVHRYSRRQQRREVEGGEDCEAIAESEEGVGRWWERARRGRAKEASEMCIFPEAE